jgi:GTP-binding protein LepA
LLFRAKEVMKIRNFCIIAHIDHGKSTLADRFLEITKTVSQRLMKNQILDQMDLERERGITIKLQPVTMNYNGYQLNLIDTPGHVDFTYEVSRSLAAVEAAILLVDASQGIEAQTIANLYLAVEQNLIIIPVINKIDLPAAQISATEQAIKQLLGNNEPVICVSAKTGLNVEEILKAVINRVPEPRLSHDNNLSCLIFDSFYDEFVGVVAYIRLFSGTLKAGDKIVCVASKTHATVLEVGKFTPARKKIDKLQAGEIGYVITGTKDLRTMAVGDTITSASQPGQSLSGYKKVVPMVYASIFPKDGDAFVQLRSALEKLSLNDSALVFEPEVSQALGFGFRCGFLGLLHVDIIKERLSREYNLELILTPPLVAYKIRLTNEENATINSPRELPSPEQVKEILEPYVILDIVAPASSVGSIISLAQDHRGLYKTTEYLSSDRVILKYEIPLAMILTDFYDKLKSASAGFASMNYEVLDYRPADVVKMDILVAEEEIESLSLIVYRDQAFTVGRQITAKLKTVLPRQQFVVKIQARVGNKIIASEHLSALRKDVTAKLYGGDVTRKRKLLEKQKKGKKKMAGRGRVDIPTDAFWAVLRRDK